MSDIGKGSTVEAFGLATNYHEAGSGTPVVLLHGSGPGVSAFDCFRIGIDPLQYFNPEFDEIFLDSLGYLDNPPPSSRKVIEKYLPKKRKTEGMGKKIVCVQAKLCASACVCVCRERSVYVCLLVYTKS